MKTFLNIGSIVLVLCSTAAVGSTLNDPKKATPDYKIMGVYEKQMGEGYSVAYHLEFDGDKNMPGYLLSLIIENQSAHTINLAPEVFMIDRKGRRVLPASYSGTLRMAEILASTEIPKLNLSGTDGSGFSSGFANGFALGVTMAAQKRRSRGSYLFRLLHDDWLQHSYTLQQGGIVLGRVFFDRDEKHALPIRVKVSINGTEHEFITRK